jgi:hypothetical protein
VCQTLPKVSFANSKSESSTNFCRRNFSAIFSSGVRFASSFLRLDSASSRSLRSFSAIFSSSFLLAFFFVG